LSSEAELAAALAAIDGALERSDDPDDVLRDVLDVLHGLYEHAAIAFVEQDELVVGPSRGGPREPTHAIDIRFRGVNVAELRVAPAPRDAEEATFLARVAERISPYCLVGWDTGGVPWGDG
jgi:hypothetical protein